MNELWEKMDLMMPGYLSSLTHSVSIRLLTLPPHHPSLTHSRSLSSGYISLSHPMSQFFTLRLLFVTVTTNCHTVLDRIQVLAVEGDRVQHVKSMRKEKKTVCDCSTNSICLVRMANSGSVTQSSVSAWLLSLAGLRLHIICH